ncbi:MAG: GeoRSP system SPASM domain protein [Nitrospiraceae bacterium]|nr:GeoRSP system SPASM domain protein [Nitrospiraceae bacterium]
MNLSELTSPIRVYWDLAGWAPGPALRQKICEEIAEAKILFLGLSTFDAGPVPSCADIIGRLKDRNIALSLTVPPGSFPSASAMRAAPAVKAVLIQSSSLDDVRASVEAIKKDGGFVSLSGISFEVKRGNYRDIPGLVSFCLDSGVRSLVFPIQRLCGGEEVFYLDEKEREGLGHKLRGIGRRGLQVTIHDPFLWLVFYPGTDYHEGSCQAANSMLYISPDCRVYPCPAMPLELGDLKKTTLMEIIHSEEKKELRKALHNPPGQCAPCVQAGKCHGGCRGRAFALARSFNCIDPSCG